MKHKASLHTRKLFRERGQVIGIMSRREIVDDDGILHYTYSEPLNVLGMIYSTRGFRETWYEVGYEDDVDYVITVEPTVEVYSGDLIDIGNGIKVRVDEKLPRGSGFRVQYWELLCNKDEG